MNPYMSWAILLVVVGGLGWYYTGGPNHKGKPTISKPVVEKSDAIISSKKPKRKPKKSPEPNGLSTPAAKPEDESRNTPTPTAATDNKPNDESDNKDFAMRLSKVKNGTPIVPATKNGPSKKDRRSQKLNNKKQGSGSSEVSGSHISTRSSSTAGADADDDMSPATSPMIAPATGDVSDMLEAPADGPSVLRLTGSVEEKKKQKPQAFKPVETKKQRQQKAKNEAKRLQVEEAEKHRRDLLEKQLKASRTIERLEAAKFKPAIPLENAWTTKNVPKTNGVATSPAPAPVPAPAPANHDSELLDTFTPVSSGKKPNGKKTNGKAVKAQANVQQQSSAAQASNAAQASKATSGNWTDELPSEEEQMRMLGAMSSENEWTTVPSKKKDKKTAKGNGDGAESNEVQANGNGIQTSSSFPTWLA